MLLETHNYNFNKLSLFHETFADGMIQAPNFSKFLQQRQSNFGPIHYPDPLQQSTLPLNLSCVDSSTVQSLKGGQVLYTSSRAASTLVCKLIN
jgi:hypothetical protein